MPSSPPAGVLLVDDDELVLNALARTLRSRQRPVHTASAASQALEVLVAQCIGVIVCEPRHAEHAAFLIDACRRYPNVTRIILTGYPDMDSVLKAVNEAHPFKLLTKPWMDDELQAMVELGLEQYALHCRRDRLIGEYTGIRASAERAHALRALDGFLHAVRPGMGLPPVDELPVGALVLAPGQWVRLNPVGRRMLTELGLLVPQAACAVAELPAALQNLVQATLAAPPLQRTSQRLDALHRLDFFTVDTEGGTLVAFASHIERDTSAP